MKLYKAAMYSAIDSIFFAHDPKGESFQLSGKLTLLN